MFIGVTILGTPRLAINILSLSDIGVDQLRVTNHLVNKPTHFQTLAWILEFLATCWLGATIIGTPVPNINILYDLNSRVDRLRAPNNFVNNYAHVGLPCKFEKT